MGLKLFKHTYKNTDLFYTSEMIEDRNLINKQKLDIACWRTEEHYLEKNQDYLKIVDINFKKTGLEKKAILTAHGDSIKKEWFYFNEDAGWAVQNWIDEMDGKYNVLILDICNPKQAQIKSEKSIIIHPNENVSNTKLMQEETQFDLYIPSVGYFNSYLLEEQLKELKEK